MSMTEEQAYLTLQQQSRQTRKSMKQIAEAIILSEEVKRSSKSAS
jgi:uroporphyrinogen-III synthase